MRVGFWLGISVWDDDATMKLTRGKWCGFTFMPTKSIILSCDVGIFVYFMNKLAFEDAS